MTNSDRHFILHHLHDSRVGLCASDDPNPPPEDAITQNLGFHELVALMDDIEETLQWCIAKDGTVEEDD